MNAFIRSAIFAVLAAAYATPAIAATLDCGSILLPPAKYRQPLTLAPNVLEVAASDVDRTCRSLGGASAVGIESFSACSFAASNLIVLPVGVPAITRYCLVLHEDAHLGQNFWPESHPGGYYGNPFDPRGLTS